MYTDLFSSMDGAYSTLIWLPGLLVIFSFLSPKYNSVVLSTTLWGASNLWSGNSLARYQPFKLMLTSLFILLVYNNFLGLTPVSYGLTSDLFSVSCLALSLWLVLLLSGWFYSPTKSAAHLLPSGSPMGLAPFLVVIETISILIRPLTLSVRMMANISAGHVVLGLLANTLSSFWMHPGLFMLIPLNVSYMLFEFFVCVIQAYIFSLLISLYQEEHP